MSHNHLEPTPPSLPMLEVKPRVSPLDRWISVGVGVPMLFRGRFTGRNFPKIIAHFGSTLVILVYATKKVLGVDLSPLGGSSIVASRL